MVLRLPPLNPLRFFEAAARLASFKAVAEELGVTPSAVSHGIQTLENWLGVELFVRQRGRIVLTAIGAKYLPSVCDALNMLSSATDRIPRHTSHQSLTLKVEQAFAFCWLLPRLSQFIGNFPNIELVICGSQRNEFMDGSLTICPAHKPSTNDIWLPLMHEVLTPVCAPLLLEQINRQGAPALIAAPLIHVTTAREDWEFFLESRNYETFTQKGELKFDSINLAMQAAREGLGIALGRLPLVESDLRVGHLAELGLGRMTTKNFYWLVGEKITFEQVEVRGFRDWLMLVVEEESASQLDPLPARRQPPEQWTEENGYYFLD